MVIWQWYCSSGSCEMSFMRWLEVQCQLICVFKLKNQIKPTYKNWRRWWKRDGKEQMLQTDFGYLWLWSLGTEMDFCNCQLHFETLCWVVTKPPNYAWSYIAIFLAPKIWLNYQDQSSFAGDDFSLFFPKTIPTKAHILHSSSKYYNFQNVVDKQFYLFPCFVMIACHETISMLCKIFIIGW